MTTLALLVGYVVLGFWAALAGVLAYCWLEHEVQRGLAWLQGRLSVTLRDAPRANPAARQQEHAPR